MIFFVFKKTYFLICWFASFAKYLCIINTLQPCTNIKSTKKAYSIWRPLTTCYFTTIKEMCYSICDTGHNMSLRFRDQQMKRWLNHWKYSLHITKPSALHFAFKSVCVDWFNIQFFKPYYYKIHPIKIKRGCQKAFWDFLRFRLIKQFNNKTLLFVNKIICYFVGCLVALKCLVNLKLVNSMNLSFIWLNSV